MVFSRASSATAQPSRNTPFSAARSGFAAVGEAGLARRRDLQDQRGRPAGQVIQDGGVGGLGVGLGVALADVPAAGEVRRARGGRGSFDRVGARVERLHGDAVGRARDEALVEVGALEHLLRRAPAKPPRWRLELWDKAVSASDMLLPARRRARNLTRLPIGRPIGGDFDAQCLRRRRRADDLRENSAQNQPGCHQCSRPPSPAPAGSDRRCRRWRRPPPPAIISWVLAWVR